MLRTFRILLVPLLIGALSLNWALADLDAPGDLGTLIAAPESDRLWAGAARVSIVPAPDPDAGEVWETEGCATLGDDAAQAPTHVPDFRSPWPENPNCIYTGGYGIGPMNPMTSVDDLGLWVRSVALSDGQDTVVLTILDGTSYFGEYARMCEGCGAFDLAAELGSELDIDPAGLYFASTHSHTAPDFIGGWGGVPQWYMDQVADALRDAVREAVTGMRPAVLEAGEVLAREHNRERRDTYRSAEDAGLAWFRAVAVGGDGEPAGTIATLGTYAAHPTTADNDEGVGHPDWPGLFVTRAEERFGGVGLLFMTGLGNMSAAGGTQMGARLADLVPGVGQGAIVRTPDVRVAQEFWNQPVTNSALTALGTPGFFDRPFASTPATVSVGKSDNKPCTSASPVSVRTAVSAARVGSGLVITGAPGEVFSNLTNAIKERHAGAVTLPLAQVNDGLGYIGQSFESDPAARQALGFVGADVFEYEDAYSLDQCFGDMVLETTLGLLAEL